MTASTDIAAAYPARRRVSQHYGLGVGQDQLDFVDIDIWGDDPLYIDPRALRTLRTPWTDECVTLLQDFFRTVIDLIRKDRHAEARFLLRQLREPNETHLGLSRGLARGRALGPGSAHDVWDALVDSEAIRSGLLEDLEETVLMVEGISFDKVSDIATNVIRGPLIEFTQQQAESRGIPIKRVGSGPLWDPAAHAWAADYVDLPVAGNGKLLLVPKAVVRRKLHFRPDDYFQHYILEFLVEQELSSNSELVYLLKDGTPRVNKKDVVKKYGRGKRFAAEITKQYPEILDRYRQAKGKRGPRPLDHDELADTMPGAATPDWDELLTAVKAVKPGKQGADAYHRAVEALLTPLLHPALVSPEREHRLHDGRKRIDLTYANQAESGFFGWIAQHHPAMYIVIECKNYPGDPANPELDQISGRFSPSRSQVGLLLCRAFEDKPLFIKRCRDTANDQRGFVIALDDDDLTLLVEARRDNDDRATYQLLKQRFDQLVM